MDIFAFDLKTNGTFEASIRLGVMAAQSVEGTWEEDNGEYVVELDCYNKDGRQIEEELEMFLNGGRGWE